MRTLLAFARAWSLTTALGLALALTLAGAVLGTHLLPVPFLEEAVEAGRVLPAPLAACGALVVSRDWAQYERVASRPQPALLGLRWVAGAAIARGAAHLTAARPDVVGALFVLLALLATLVPRYWWLALPPLLYLQLFVPTDLLPGSAR